MLQLQLAELFHDKDICEAECGLVGSGWSPVSTSYHTNTFKSQSVFIILFTHLSYSPISNLTDGSTKIASNNPPRRNQNFFLEKGSFYFTVVNVTSAFILSGIDWIPQDFLHPSLLRFYANTNISVSLLSGLPPCVVEILPGQSPQSSCVITNL